MTRPSAFPIVVGPPRLRYSTVAIILHWAIAALLFGEVALGLRMEGLHGPARFAVFQLHKSVGITILLLVALRLVWRLIRTPPPVGARGWERGLAHAVHALFYLLLFALPLSGWTIVSTSRIVVPTLLYGAVPLPHLPGLAALPPAVKAAWNGTARFTHVNLVLVLYAGFALHVAGVLRHQWFDRDGNVARMVPGVRPGRVADPRLMLIALAAAGVVGLALWAPATPTAAPLAARPSTVLPSPATGSVAPALPPLATPPAQTTAQVAPAPVTPAVSATDAGTSAPAAPATAPTWIIQPGSTLHWQTTWSGQTIDGGFGKFDGTIVFDPDALDRSRVAITVTTASVFSGDAQRDDTLKSGDWFATDSSPTATYAATRFRRTAPGRYVAAGTLHLKGASLPVPVTFTLTIAGDTATMHGTAAVDRTRFKIGEGEFAATTDIPAAVALDMAVTARRQ